MARLQDKVVFVGGGGSRVAGAIGRTSAVLYASEGARVFVADIDEAAAAATVAEIENLGGTAAQGIGDLGVEADVERLVGEALARFGRIDGLHNNIATTRVGTPPELPLDDWNESWRINVTSQFLACRHVLPVMERQGGGAIVNISSVAGIRHLGVPALAYYTTKGAVTQFTRVLAVQYASRGIRVNSVSPGFVLTPDTGRFLTRNAADPQITRLVETRESQTPMRRRATALEVAKAALFLISDDASYVTGADLVVDGGLSAAAVLPPA